MVAYVELLGVLLIAPWGFRLMLLTTTHGWQGGTLVRGFLADLVVALAVLPVVVWLQRRSRWIAVAAVGVWCLVHAANDEHIRVLGAMANFENLRYLADSTFLKGSAQGLLRPTVVILSLVSVVMVAVRARGPVGSGPRHWLLVVALGLLLSSWPTQSDDAPWQQENVVLSGLIDLAGQSRLSFPSETHPGRLDVHAPDLGGVPRIPLGHPGTNVLLIMLEGISGGHLPSVAGVSGIEPPASLRGLDELATAQHQVFSRFVAQQRQTSRGQYALLCGDAPAFSGRRTRMAEVAMAEGDAPCLPNALATLGYQTVYLQAAPLAFQRKNQFMPKAGFRRALGADSFGDHPNRTPWGVDDATLFARAADLIDELEHERAPWFVTLLTVGTHHPFLVPGAPKEYDTERAFSHAATYLDDALAGFLATLDRRGISDRTLIIVTSDESGGLGLGGSHQSARRSHAATKALHQAWGLLSIRTPEGDGQRVDELFGQSDLALSVLDYLGQPPDAYPFGGRSVFRRYRAPRPVAFANTYLKRTGAFFGDDQLVVCNRLGQACMTHALEGGFGRLGNEIIDTDPSQLAWLRSAIDAPSRLAIAATNHAPRWWSPLFEAGSLSVVEDSEAMLEGRFRFAARSRVTVTVEATFSGNTPATFLHQLQLDGGGRYQVDFPALIDGDQLVLRYVVLTTGVSSTQAAVTASLTGPDSSDAALVFRKAGVLLEPAAEASIGTTATVRLEAAQIDRDRQIVDRAGAWRRAAAPSTEAEDAETPGS